MEKELICIECPKGCGLTVDWEGCMIRKITGNQCPKGEDYARQEVLHPVRILTTSVLCEGLSVKMLPVRTSRPIPKARLREAMQEVKKLRVSRPVKTGEVIVRDFLGLGADLVSTRDVSAP